MWLDPLSSRRNFIWSHLLFTASPPRTRVPTFVGSKRWRGTVSDQLYDLSALYVTIAQRFVTRQLDEICRELITWYIAPEFPLSLISPGPFSRASGA